MSGKPEKPVQFILPIGGGAVNQCFFVSEDELEEKQRGADPAELLERAAAGKLSARSLTRHRETLLREAIRTDRAELLGMLMGQKRMELARFLAVLTFAEECRSPDASAWLLAYREEHYRAGELEDYEQRRLDLELGMTAPDERELRRIFRLRHGKKGVFICGPREQLRSYEIPAAIGGKTVAGVETGAFYALQPMPRVRRDFPARSEAAILRPAMPGETLWLGRAPAKKGAAEEPIPWRVLCREEGRMLLLCERAVASLAYHRELEEVSWEKSDLRRWLNQVFLPLCFSPEERECILKTRVRTADNPNFGSLGGEEAEDRLFLLSIEEALALLPDDKARAIGCWWWLRTPGFDNSFAATVTPDGGVVRIGSFVDAEDDAVRPAMWVREREA